MSTIRIIDYPITYLTREPYFGMESSCFLYVAPFSFVWKNAGVYTGASTEASQGEVGGGKTVGQRA